MTTTQKRKDKAAYLNKKYQIRVIFSLFALDEKVALLAKGNYCECINYTLICWLASDFPFLKSVLYGVGIKISYS